MSRIYRTMRGLFVVGCLLTAAACSVSTAPGVPATQTELLSSPLLTKAPASVATALPSAAVATSLMNPVPSADPGGLPAPQTVVITATPTPPESTQARLTQLTADGCCVQPFWSPDSRGVLFLDRPAPSEPVGLWMVGREGGPAQFVTDKLGIFTRDLSLRAFPEGGQTMVENLADGRRWQIPNGGRSVSFSPSGTQLAWTTGQSGPPLDTAQRQIWIANSDGSQPRQVATITGGGFSGWLDDERILLSQPPDQNPNLQALWMMDIGAEATEGAAVELARGTRIRSTLVSPEGGWLVYMITFSDDAALDGLWLVNTTNGQRRKLELFGAYRWRDENRLLIVPQELDQPSNRIVQVEAATGEMMLLTDPAVMPFKIAGGDWSVSPDGNRVVFLSAQDNNLWMIELAE